MIPKAHLFPNSFFTVAIAATHGVYKSEKIKKTNAVNFVNIAGNASVPPQSTDSVEITLSFAKNPDRKAVETRQSAMPNGSNIGVSEFPTIANKFSVDSVTKFNLESKCCRNHTKIDTTKIIVNANFTKFLTLKYTSRIMLWASGIR